MGYQRRGAEALGYEFEALAIYDLMRYVKPPVSTLCVGNAFGEAAMLLAAGEQVQFCGSYFFILFVMPWKHDTNVQVYKQPLKSASSRK